MNAQIAQHLNIAEALIAEVQEWAHVLFVRFTSGRPLFVSKKVVNVKKITVEQVSASGLRTRKPEIVAEIANKLAACSTPVRSCDPIQVWEAHPVISECLDDLSDREISAAIELAQSSGKH